MTVAEASTKPRASSAALPLGQKALETALLTRSYLQRARRPIDMTWLSRNLAEYDALLSAHARRGLREARVFEVGYGARPYRQIALHSLGVDVSGVDIERPLLRMTPSELARVYRRNGAERALKSLVRSAVFDPRERRALAAELARWGAEPQIDPSRLLLSDAGDLELPESHFDMVLSEEVVQSIELTSLERLVQEMARWLKPDGIALIRATVFTGITGGLLQEWSRWSLAHPPRHRRSEPWEHLRRRRFRPNTHANELTRAGYRELFGGHFTILEERVQYPDLGREYLTPEIAAELSAYPDEELFSNQILFVLRRRG